MFKTDAYIVGTVNLNIACFRFIVDGLSDEELNKLNYDIFGQVIADPKCGFLPSVVDGKTVLRVSITNNRTKFEDMDFLVDYIVGIGKNVS